jgi:hypothetical protein
MVEARGAASGGEARLKWGVALGLALAAFGCLGGQTGQPASFDGSGGTCGVPIDIPVTEPIRRVVPVDAAAALEGSYVEPLSWFDGSAEAQAEDELTLTFTYDGGPAAYDRCGSGGPQIEMQLDVTTAVAGLMDAGPVWVSFFPPRPGTEPFGPSGAFGSFQRTTGLYSISGTLLQTASGTRVRGRFAPVEPSPLSYGDFGPPLAP